MALEHSIAVIGAGSLRCAGPVLASLFNFQWPYGSRLTLCDPHHEALDLFDRLARAFAATQDTGMSIQSTDDMSEALKDVHFVILCFGLGDHSTAVVEECMKSVPGDREQRARELSRGILLHHKFAEVNDLLYKTDAPPDVVINLVAPVEMSEQLLSLEAIHLDWPPQLAQEGRVPAAHHALRLVRGEDLPVQEIRAHVDSPLLEALLDHRPPPENRFNPTAVARWLDELEELTPGCRELLMQ